MTAQASQTGSAPAQTCLSLPKIPIIQIPLLSTPQLPPLPTFRFGITFCCNIGLPVVTLQDALTYLGLGPIPPLPIFQIPGCTAINTLLLKTIGTLQGVLDLIAIPCPLDAISSDD